MELASKDAGEEQGADKQLQQGVFILAEGIARFDVLQVGVEAMLEVRVPTFAQGKMAAEQ